jgi:hypothetical protein
MNTEPVILSPEHSARLRALQHLVPFYTMDELIEELIFAVSPDNYLANMEHDWDGPELGRIKFTLDRGEEIFTEWDAMVEAAKNIPAYNSADYPAPVTKPTNIVSFEIIK